MGLPLGSMHVHAFLCLRLTRWYGLCGHWWRRTQIKQQGEAEAAQLHDKEAAERARQRAHLEVRSSGAMLIERVT